jgi:hypothetical protein
MGNNSSVEINYEDGNKLIFTATLEDGRIFSIDITETPLGYFRARIIRISPVSGQVVHYLKGND